jgi:hypothetical protein
MVCIFYDYTALSPVGLEADTTYAQTLSNCWASTLPQEGKALPFSDKFKTLELVVDTEKAGPGGKHPERSAELLQNIDEVLAQKQISTKTLEQLHGRIVWFRTFIFDRKFNAATRTIS